MQNESLDCEGVHVNWKQPQSMKHYLPFHRQKESQADHKALMEFQQRLFKRAVQFP